MYSKKMGLSWGLNDVSGWGVFGTNLCKELMRKRDPLPILMEFPNYKDAPADVVLMLKSLLPDTAKLREAYDNSNRVLNLKNTLVLHSLGDGFVGGGMSARIEGERNVGFIFFEKPFFGDDVKARANSLDRVIVGSSWNKALLNMAGIESRKVLQGIDDMLFYPRPRGDKYGDKFVVFSAGKLEIRKGQDQVLRAFKIFHERHPDSILVTAWQNLWPESVKGIERMPGIEVLPNLKADGTQDIEGWASAHGLPSGSVVDIGMLSHFKMAQEYKHADVAVFASRAEGGTNLPAMEAMASGIACILSKNSGHLDIMQPENCLALEKQSAFELENYFSFDWKDSDIDEMVEHLETLYTDTQKRKQIAQDGSEFMRTLSWRNQVGALVSELDDLLR